MSSRIVVYNIVWTSFITTLLLFGSVSIINDTLFNFLPIGALLTASLVGATWYWRVPPPKQEDVDRILGPDPCMVQDDKSVITTGAHRGAGLDAPENSLIAFQQCAERGVNLVEFDVSLTLDNVPVVYHDNTLERLTDNNVSIDSVTWSELCKFDIAVKHPYKEKYKNTHIPSLEETVKQLLNSNQKMFIDLKGFNTNVVDIIVKMFKVYPQLHNSAIVTSFYPHLIYMIRRQDPSIVCSLAWRPYCMSTESFSFPDGAGPRRTNSYLKHYYNVFLDALYEWSLGRIIYYFCGISIVLLHKDAISGKVILDWRERGVRVVAWTVNHPLEKQHYSRVLKITYLTDTLTGEATAHLPIPSSTTDGNS